MMAVVVDFPTCRATLRMALLEPLFSRRTCQGSGRMNLSAKPTRSKASLRSSLSSAICRAFQLPQNRLAGARIRLQGGDDDRPELQPLRGQVEVYLRPLV